MNLPSVLNSTFWISQTRPSSGQIMRDSATSSFVPSLCDSRMCQSRMVNIETRNRQPDSRASRTNSFSPVSNGILGITVLSYLFPMFLAIPDS
ncbi:hypothetical protein DL98DRAFT_309538 [Cadophora sp. DSE1049]|nr:hypothetical protein DL98DRAFT_309538 [Cadophora sp. DSE1049]